MEAQIGVLFSCGDCPKTFSKRMDYNRHRKRHDRPHQCSICDKSFGLKTDRDRHRTTHKTKAFKFMCKFPGCGFKGTSRRDYLLTHMRHAHERTETPTSKNAIRLYYQQASNEEQVSQAEERDLKLLEAAGQGDEEKAKELISMGANVLACDSSRTTAGDLAASRGHLNILQLLIGVGVDVNIMETDPSLRRFYKIDPWLHQALRNGHFTTAEFLVKCGADIDAETWEKQTAFEEAAIRGSEDAMRLLHGLGANVYAGKRLQSLFHEIIRRGKESTMSLLLELGANVTEYSKVTTGGITGVKQLPLHTAAETGRVPIAKLLLDHGSSIRALSSVNETALFPAIREGHLHMVEFLLEHGADIHEMPPSFREEPSSTLLSAVNSRHMAIVEMLLEKGVNVRLQRQREVWELSLFRAIVDSEEGIVRLLLKWGCNINNTASDTLTLLCFSGQISKDMTKLMVELEADFEALRLTFSQELNGLPGVFHIIQLTEINF